MQILTKSVQYNFDNDGNTNSVSVGLQGQDSPNFVTSSMNVSASDLPTGQVLDDLSKNEIVAIARKKLAAFTAVSETSATETSTESSTTTTTTSK